MKIYQLTKNTFIYSKSNVYNLKYMLKYIFNIFNVQYIS